MPPYVSVLLSAIGVVIFLVNREKLSPHKIIASYLLFSIITDLFLTPVLFRLSGNQFLGAKVFTFVEFYLLLIFLNANIKTNSKKILFRIFITIFSASFIYQITFGKNNNFDSIATGVSSLLLMIFSLFFLFDKISNNQSYFTFDSISIVVSALIIYFSGTFFIYISSSNYINSNKFQELYTMINSLVLITRNILIIIGFFKLLKENIHTPNVKNKLGYL